MTISLKKEFRQSLKCGTGRAYIIARDNPQIDFSKDIIKVALDNYTYGPFCENGRPEYIGKFTEFCRDKNLLIGKVLTVLAKERKDATALDFWFDLAAIWAVNGNSKAAKAIYKRFSQKHIKDNVGTGHEALIKVHGLEGIKLFASVMGGILQDDPEIEIFSYVIEDFQKSSPETDVLSELKKASRGDNNIKYYLAELKKETKQEKQHKVNKVSAYEWVTRVIESSARANCYAMSSRLTKMEVKKLAKSFLTETNKQRQYKYLTVFAKKKFPYDYKIILDIAKGLNNNPLMHYACQSLKFHSGNDIRRFALDHLSRTTNPARYLYMLVNNYRDPDAKLLTGIIDRCKSSAVLHDIAYSICDIYKTNSTRFCQKPLELLYAKTACNFHRFNIVNILYENEVLTKHILDEIQFDANEKIRAMYHKINKKKKRVN